MRELCKPHVRTTWLQRCRAAPCRFDATQLRKGVREHTSYSDVPHLSEAFVHQNLKHLMALHVIKPPGK